MRNLLSTVLLLAATLAASAQNDLKSVLSQLDATLSHRDSYIAGREQRIESLKNILRKSDFSDAQRYILNQQLIDEYTPYQADSTIDYLYRNIALATRMNDAGHLNESRIQLAYLYSSAGIYLEAANMLKLVDTTALDRRQLVDYYIARHKLNDELQLYSHDSAQGHESWRLTVIYAQLIVENTEPESVTHLNFRLRQAIGARDYPQAVEISERLCSTLQPLSREYAEASYMRALVADLMDDTPTAQVWFARSAMTDIQLGDPRQRRTEKPRQHAARRRQHPARHALHADRDGRRTVLQFAAPPVAGRTGAARHRRGLPGPAAADGRHVQHLRRVDRLLHAAGPRGRGLRPAAEPQAEPCCGSNCSRPTTGSTSRTKTSSTSTSDWQD